MLIVMRYRRLLQLALLTFTLIPLTAFSQTRPRSLDDGDTRVTPRPVTEKVRGLVSVQRRAAYNWVIVRPDLEKAEVRIDGKLVPKSKDDDYRMELPVGKRYTVAVSAGFWALSPVSTSDGAGGRAHTSSSPPSISTSPPISAAINTASSLRVRLPSASCTASGAPARRRRSSAARPPQIPGGHDL